MVDPGTGTIGTVGDETQSTARTSTTRTDAALGPNAWLVDEMYEQYLADPGSVSESWRDFFADYRRDADHMAPPTPAGQPDAEIYLPATTLLTARNVGCSENQ